jgi:hypothetical protein
VDELISEGLCMFTDKDDEHGTIDLDKCGEEANLYRTKKAVADRRLAAAKKKEDARVKAEADRLAKAKAAAAARRQEEERLARLQKADAEAKAKKKASAGKSGGKDSKASKASRASKGASKPNPSGLKRVAERPSEPNDSGAEILMAAAALMDSGEEVDLNGAILTSDARVIARSAKRRKGGAFDKTTAPPPSPPARAKPPAKTTKVSASTINSPKSKEELIAEAHREKFLKATAAAEKAKRDAAAAKARADAAFEAAKRLGENSPQVLAKPPPKAPSAVGPVSPARRAATKTSLMQRLEESTKKGKGPDGSPRVSNPTAEESPSSEETERTSDGGDGSDEATDDDAPLAAPKEAPPLVPSEDDTRVETTVETADALRDASERDATETFPVRADGKQKQTKEVRADRDPTASQTFAGATPTSWIARLLTSRMSGDPTIRAAFFCALCAVEEKRFDFAERVLREHDFECGWRFRLLEYLDRVRGRDASAAENARNARRCEQSEHVAREQRRERDARESDAFQEREKEKAKAKPLESNSDDAFVRVDSVRAGGGGPGPARPPADESDPFFDERPGAGLKILDAGIAEANENVSGKRTRDGKESNEKGSSKKLVPAVPGDRHAVLLDTRAFVKASPLVSAAAQGVAPSGPLPVRGASGSGCGALGAAFAIFAENAGACDLTDFARMRRLAKRDAAARPTESVTLTFAGLLAWRVGDLEGAKAPLRAAMHHDGGSARAAPLLFEVLLTLDETDEAEVVWDTALHRGESGPTYERLIAVALRCGEGAAGDEESDRPGEGDSERR